jgi:hypothetical protein
MKINHHLTGQSDVFSSDVYVLPDAVDKIKAFLNTLQGRSGELSLSSKKTYVAALSSFLDIAHIDSKPYRDLIRELAQQIKTSDITPNTYASNVSAQTLRFAIESPKTHFHIKILAALILYGYVKQVKLVDLIQTRHDIDNGSDNFLDIQNARLIIRRSDTLPITLRHEFIDIIRTGMGDTWITGDAPADLIAISKRFKKMFQYSYSTVAKMLNQTESDDSSDEESPPEITEADVPIGQCSSEEAGGSSVVTGGSSVHPASSELPPATTEIPTTTSEPPATEQEMPPIKKLKISLKLKSNIRSPHYEWTYFRRQDADDIHIKRVQQLMDMITTDHMYFYHNLIDTPTGADLIKEKLSTVQSLNTQVNYCNSLCKFLELTMARHYSDFTHLRDVLTLDLHRQNAARSVKPYNEIVPALQKCISLKTSVDLKIMATLLLSIQNFSDMNTGALRPSDVMNTRLIDDGKHHFLDLLSKTWTLREAFTKNKQTRSAVISDEFRDYLLTLRDTIGTLPLICRSGKTTNLSKEFKKHIGINFSEARASYVTFLDSVCDDVETIKHICNNQGHKLTTALESYRRHLEEEEEDQV